MHRYLENPETGRLRAGWRILAFLAVFLVTTSASMVGVRMLLGGLRRGSTLQFTILGVAATVSVLIARRYFDRKSLVSLGLHIDRLAALDIASGIVNSALVMAGMFLTLRALGLINVEDVSWWGRGSMSGPGVPLTMPPAVLLVLYELVLVAWWEELVFRGYLFQNLIDGVGLAWSIVVTSLVFGFGHAFNPEATLLSSVLIALITPQLIYAYLATGQLWLPIGLHLGWNFFQASVFGFAASGLDSPSLITQSPASPDWLSGGAFGAEGSVLILPFTALSVVLIHAWVRLTRSSDESRAHGSG
ncbi:MAG: CPBP family intramembrane metalloprotease [Gemmatimonadales bacterium]|jgi:membrane protease YdiL (CAAX protease family)